MAAEIVDLQAIIAARQIQCIHERARLERWISSIPDSFTRQIFAYRFIEGYSWVRVARIIGGNTPASVKQRCYRYLKECDGKGPDAPQDAAEKPQAGDGKEIYPAEREARREA